MIGGTGRDEAIAVAAADDRVCVGGVFHDSITIGGERLVAHAEGSGFIACFAP